MSTGFSHICGQLGRLFSLQVFGLTGMSASFVFPEWGAAGAYFQGDGNISRQRESKYHTLWTPMCLWTNQWVEHTEAPAGLAPWPVTYWDSPASNWRIYVQPQKNDQLPHFLNITQEQTKLCSQPGKDWGVGVRVPARSPPFVSSRGSPWRWLLGGNPDCDPRAHLKLTLGCPAEILRYTMSKSYSRNHLLFS